jgi:hypothetical protein
LTVINHAAILLLEKEVYVRPELKSRVLIILLVGTLIAVAGTLKGRDDYMEKLPVYRQFQCAICHQSSNPISGMDLNDFGKDFKKYGYQWNSTLAGLDSDGDGFSNGIELGDENGDGTPEVSLERSNPGDPVDQPSSVDPKTWSILKGLFAED